MTTTLYAVGFGRTVDVDIEVCCNEVEDVDADVYDGIEVVRDVCVGAVGPLVMTYAMPTMIMTSTSMPAGIEFFINTPI